MTKRPISADSHVTEPPNCYVDYIDPAWRERAPRVVRHETQGDLYVIDGLRCSYQKLRQRAAIDYPLLTVAAAGALDAQGLIERLKIVVSALGARPRLITGLEKVAYGRPLAADTMEAVAARAFQQCHPLENMIVDPEWRRAMVPVYVRRALAELAGESDQTGKEEVVE